MVPTRDRGWVETPLGCRSPEVCARAPQEQPKSNPRDTQGIPKGYPRDTQGIPKGYLREQHTRNTGAIPEQHPCFTLGRRLRRRGYMNTARPNRVNWLWQTTR